MGIKPGLDVTLALLAELHNPHLSRPVIHVAGTNGKGSVCAMLESILRAAGLKTGLYTSPHLVSFNERFILSGKPVDDAQLMELVQVVEEADNRCTANGFRPATFFEFSTVMAFHCFAREPVDIVILETGMGGLWDATNVVQPELSVITSVDLDHQQYLGDTLEAIAAEKSGIIKERVPCVSGEVKPAAEKIIVETAARLHAPLFRVEQECSCSVKNASLTGQRLTIETSSCRIPTATLPLLGEHQARNAVIAAQAAVCLMDRGYPLTPELIARGMEQVHWPARFQVLSTEPPVILDGAHNPSAVTATLRAMRGLLKTHPMGVVFASMRDKDAVQMLCKLHCEATVCWCAGMSSERAYTADELETIARVNGVPCMPGQWPDLLKTALEWARKNDGAILVTGSLYLAGEVLAHVEREGLE